MTAKRLLGVIPARYASSRLPGKPLMDIGGKSMVQRVMEQAQQCASLAEVVVATDDGRIVKHVQDAGGRAVLTATAHPSGTDRCWEALEHMGADRFDGVVNIQGDEPFIAPAQIDELCAVLSRPDVHLATLAQVVTDDADLTDPGEVLITVDGNMNALYFSRAAIPFLRNAGPAPRHAQFRYLKHVGLYGYSTQVLKEVVRLKPSPLELAESLEQLRWLEHGYRVRIGLTAHVSFCVDTLEDLEAARRYARQRR
jgi:3-deoxy-manno-octulosonate cytidylyltransferase (CMP-KDO synthetase)